MKVGRLIAELKEFNEDAEVVIAEFQDYGSDFAYGTSEVNVFHVDKFSGSGTIPCVAIVMGRQFGTPIKEEHDENFDELDELYRWYEDDEDDEDCE